MAYVIANGTTLAQTAYTDAGLTIGAGTISTSSSGWISGFANNFWVANTLTVASTNFYAFPNQTNTAGMYILHARAINENPGVSTLSSNWLGTVIKLTPNTTFSNVLFVAWHNIYTTIGRATTTVTNDTITFSSTALDGERAFTISLIKVI